MVNADNAQDALDEAVDYAEAQNWIGLWLDLEEAKVITDLEQYSEIIYAGNHDLPLASECVDIVQRC